MRRTLRLVGSALVGLLPWVDASPAEAAEPDAKAAAELLFDHGRALVQTGNFAEACPKFAASVELDPAIGGMLWLADCYEHTGRTASAWAVFKDAAARAEREKDARERVARRRVAALEPRLTRLIVVVPRGTPAPDLEVLRDGVRIPAGEFGVPIPIDPGVHTLTATAPGRARWSTAIEVSARPEAVTVHVPVLRREDARFATAAETGIGTSSAGAPPSGGRLARMGPTIGLVLVGVGIAAAGTGAALGLRAKAIYDDSNENGHCRLDLCDAVGREKRTAAFDLATGSTIAFVAGAGALAIGTALWVFTPREPRAATVTPTFGPNHAGVVIGRAF